MRCRPRHRDGPVSPNRSKLLFMGLFMGLVLALGVPFLIEYLDHTMTNLEQVESAFQLRGLGIVPKLDNSGAPALIDREESKETSLVENFRVIRTNLISVGSLTKTPHVLMITSAMPKKPTMRLRTVNSGAGIRRESVPSRLESSISPRPGSR